MTGRGAARIQRADAFAEFGVPRNPVAGDFELATICVMHRGGIMKPEVSPRRVERAKRLCPCSGLMGVVVLTVLAGGCREHPLQSAATRPVLSAATSQSADSTPEITRLTATITTRVTLAGGPQSSNRETRIRLEGSRNTDGTWNVRVERMLEPGLPDYIRQSPLHVEVAGSARRVLRDGFGNEVKLDRAALQSRLPRNLRLPVREPGAPQASARPFRDGWYGSLVATARVIALERDRRTRMLRDPSPTANGLTRYQAAVQGTDIVVEEDVDADRGLTVTSRLKKRGVVESTTTRVFQAVEDSYYAALTRTEVEPSGRSPGYVIEQTLTDVTIVR